MWKWTFSNISTMDLCETETDFLCFERLRHAPYLPYKASFDNVFSWSMISETDDSKIKGITSGCAVCHKLWPKVIVQINQLMRTVSSEVYHPHWFLIWKSNVTFKVLVNAWNYCRTIAEDAIESMQTFIIIAKWNRILVVLSFTWQPPSIILKLLAKYWPLPPNINLPLFL